MDSIYTTTITNEARRRGIEVEVINAAEPIFLLRHGDRQVRCFNALTDHVGAVSFLLAQDKHLANAFLARYGFPVPRQIKYNGKPAAQDFLRKLGSVVVKPSREWGGRGVSVGVRESHELWRAIARARRYGEDIVIEECVTGVDHRLIFVAGRCVAAIVRMPAIVVGNGQSSILSLIMRHNQRARRQGDGNCIPLDAETRRNLSAMGLSYRYVPSVGEKVQVRLTSNYHTGGTIRDITHAIPETLIQRGEAVVRLFQIPMLGIDFLVDPVTGQHRIIEVSPDLAISPPEGETVVRYFMDHLFPDTATVDESCAQPKRRASK